MVLIASLILFLGLCLEFLTGPFPCSREKTPAFLGSQRSFGVYLMVEVACGSPGFPTVSYVSSVNGGNLSTGLVIGCVLDIFVGVCNSNGRVEERRPVPVTVAVVMSQSSISAAVCNEISTFLRNRAFNEEEENETRNLIGHVNETK